MSNEALYVLIVGLIAILSFLVVGGIGFFLQKREQKSS